MTHDELLARIEEAIGRNTLYERVDGQVIDIYPRDADVELMLNALRAVVELHKPKFWQNPNVPEWNGANCAHCLEERGDYMSPIEASYPCPTIQAIEKELG